MSDRPAPEDDLIEERALARSYLDREKPEQRDVYLAVAEFGNALAHHTNPGHRRRALDYTVQGERLILALGAPKEERDERAWRTERARVIRDWLEIYPQRG